MVDFFKAQLITQQVLVQVPPDRKSPTVFRVKWLPGILPFVRSDSQYGLAAGVGTAFVDFVDRDVWE